MRYACMAAMRESGYSVSAGRRDAAVLLLHGLTGTPVDMDYMKQALVADGYKVSAPLLPGRGTRPSDMETLCWEDWMTSALAAYDDLASEHKDVIVGGLSAGATMTLDIALRRKPSAVLLCATALGLGNPLAYLAPYVYRVIKQWPSPASDLVDLNAGAKCYDPAPVRAVAELIHGIGLVRRRLGEIRCPALVAHSVSDRLVPVHHARNLAARLGGPVTTLYLQGTGHAITVDARRHDVADASLAFLREAIATPQRAA
ncbi:MAG: alpha/beta fold hydrolase [Chloroflexota bacterium]|nr:alpha/beta fold hydrolase [Chloroflexota bacterium]